LIFPSLTDLRNVDPDRYNQLLFGHKHTGDGDGSIIPREGIADSAINGAKIATDADVKHRQARSLGQRRAFDRHEPDSMSQTAGTPPG
jgi:hypothetical protein